MYISLPKTTTWRRKKSQEFKTDGQSFAFDFKSSFIHIYALIQIHSFNK